MTPIAMEKPPKREVLKRYPAPPCPACKSGNTIVLKTLATIRRYLCIDCDNRWKDERKG